MQIKVTFTKYGHSSSREDFSIYQRSIKINKTIEIGSAGGIGEGEGSNNSIDMILFYYFHQHLLGSFNLRDIRDMIYLMIPSIDNLNISLITISLLPTP